MAVGTGVRVRAAFPEMNRRCARRHRRQPNLYILVAAVILSDTQAGPLSDVLSRPGFVCDDGRAGLSKKGCAGRSPGFADRNGGAARITGQQPVRGESRAAGRFANVTRRQKSAEPGETTAGTGSSIIGCAWRREKAGG